jgi:DNA-binding transcriptional MerR regulator
MPIISMADEWSMTEAARLLGEPQHRLIYLCEKEVVRPEFQDAEGRGSSRRFSARNLLEFAVALRLRELEISASLVRAILHVLRAFEHSMQKEMRGFELPASLRDSSAPDLRAVIADGQRLFFTLRRGEGRPKVFGGVDLREVKSSGSLKGLERELGRSRPEASDGTSHVFGEPEGSKHARVEISVTGIARDLRLDG